MSYSIIPTPKWDKFSPVHKAYPIWFRIKVGNEPHFYKKTDIYIDGREQWNKKAKKVQKRPDADHLNVALDLKRLTLRTNIINDQSEDKELTRESIKGKKVPNFFDYAREIRGDNSTTNTILNRIKKLNGREPRLSEITAEWCRKLEYKMRTQPIPEGDKRKGKLKEVDKAKHGYSDTTINCTLRLIRRVQTTALIEGYMKKKVLGVGLYEIPAEAEYDAQFLVCEERERWRQGMVDHVLEDPEMHMVLVYFMLGCYLGLRISDWYLFNPKTKIVGDTVFLRTHKTDGKVIYKINYSLQLVLDEINIIGPLTINKNKVARLLKIISELEYFNVGKKITPHIARHSFGRFMVEEGVAESDCAAFMGISVSVVKRVYYHYNYKDRVNRYKELANR